MSPLYTAAQPGPIYNPALNNLKCANIDPGIGGGQVAPTAGVVYYARLYASTTFNYTKVCITNAVAGSGGSPANGWMGVYLDGAAGALKSKNSADAIAAMNTIGSVEITQVAEAGQTLTVFAGQYVCIALLIGTAATTPAQFTRAQTSSNSAPVMGLTAGTDMLRWFSGGSGLSALPSTSPVLASQGTPITQNYVVGLK